MSLLRYFVLGFLVALTAVTPVQAQDALHWETDLARAQQTAAQTNRLVLVHFWGTWCPPCMKMEREVFSKPGIGTAILPYYVPCKIQVEQGMNEELVKQFQVTGFPCDIVMTPQGQIVHRSAAYMPAEQYVAMLQQAAQTALTAARPVAAGAPVGAPPAGAVPPVGGAVPAPVTPPPAAANPTPPTTTRAATNGSSDDRYSYYYQDRGAAPTSPAPAAPPTVAVAAAPAVPPYAAPAVPVANAIPPSVPATSVASPTITPPLSTPIATPTPITPPVAAATASRVGDRYADYRNHNSPVANAPAMTPPPAPPVIPPAPAPAPSIAAAPVMPRAAAPVAPPTAAPVTPPVAAPVAPAPVAPPVVAQNNTPPAAETKPQLAASPSAAGTGFQLPVGSPPLALDGYCPVSVTEKMVWKKGNVNFGAIHRGRTYLFPSAEEQQRFLQDPDRYAPVISGNDPVVALEKGETVAGKREFGLMCQDRMFLFSSKESYDKFCRDSKRYVGETFQAMQAGGVQRR